MMQATGNRKQATEKFRRTGARCLLPAACQRGFTLVEMVVAVGLFAVVMMVSVEVLLSLVNANRKAQALQSVMNNLNISLDGMVRPIREGTAFNGSGASCSGNPGGGVNDCTSGTTQFSFEPFGATYNSQNGTWSKPAWVYRFAADSNGIGRVYRSVDGGNTFLAITSPEVSIQEMTFFVAGTTRGDKTQPKVIIVIKGTAGVSGTKAATTFHIQTTAVQRVLDL